MSTAKKIARTKQKSRNRITTNNNFDNCPNEKRTRGFSDSDSRCTKCHTKEDCKSSTLKRFLNVMDNLNRKLGLDEWGDPFIFHDDETSFWELIQDPLNIDGEWLDELREEIKLKIVLWVQDQEENHNNTVREDVANLDSRTLRVLDKIWPEWKEWTGQFIDKVHVTDTENLERLTWSLRMPYLIMDMYMKEMSNPAWKVFCYIARRCTFDPDRPYFGRCFLKYEEIQEWSGVLTVSKYVKELVELGLIGLIQQKKRNFSTGSVGTINLFTVNWFGEFSKLGIEGYKKKQKKGRPY